MKGLDPGGPKPLQIRIHNTEKMVRKKKFSPSSFMLMLDSGSGFEHRWSATLDSTVSYSLRTVFLLNNPISVSLTVQCTSLEDTYIVQDPGEQQQSDRIRRQGLVPEDTVGRIARDKVSYSYNIVLKVPKCENFHHTDFFYLYTIKPLWVGDFRAKIKK